MESDNKSETEKVFEIRRLLFSFLGNDSQRIILSVYIPDLIVLVWTKKWKETLELLERIRREIESNE